MNRVCLCLAVLALAAPAVSVAKGPPPGRPSHAGSPPGERGGPPIARAVAAALCVAEFRQLGASAFRAKYPNRDACLDANADEAAQILESCKTTDEARACVRAAVAAPEAGPDESARPAIPHRRPLVVVRRVAAALCGAELKSLGRDAFRAKYTTPGACLKAMAERATAIVEDAQAQCATAQRKLVCVRAGIAKALGLPTRGPRK